MPHTLRCWWACLFLGKSGRNFRSAHCTSAVYFLYTTCIHDVESCRCTDLVECVLRLRVTDAIFQRDSHTAGACRISAK